MEDENKVYTITGKIEEVTQKEKSSKPGEYFNKVKIQGMTFNVFDTKWDSFLKMGKIIKASYNKKVKGEYTYKNIFFIVDATEEEMVTEANAKPAYVPQETTNTSNAPVDWDAKDRRIVKQNVLNRAVDMYLSDKIKKEDILKTADTFLDWVYDKFPKQEEVKSIDEIEEITIED